MSTKLALFFLNHSFVCIFDDFWTEIVETIQIPIILVKQQISETPLLKRGVVLLGSQKWKGGPKNLEIKGAPFHKSTLLIYENSIFKETFSFA